MESLYILLHTLEVAQTAVALPQRSVCRQSQVFSGQLQRSPDHLEHWGLPVDMQGHGYWVTCAHRTVTFYNTSFTNGRMHVRK